jgi:hypothetical protein
MRRSLSSLAAVVAFLLLVPALAAAGDGVEGRYRVDLMNGKFIEGDVKELADGSYQVKTKYGVVLTIKRNEVRGLRALDADLSGNAEPAAAAGLTREEISDAEIERLLAGIEAEPDESLTGADRDVMLVELPLNEESLTDMKRSAGPEAKVLVKPHFVMVYTSDDAGARALASRVESIYRWKIQFLRMMNHPARRPTHKLEIYYYGTIKEFLATGAPPGAAGFYRPDDNRCYFYNLATMPGIAEALERAKDKEVPWDERQRLRNRATQAVEHYNRTVVQHETSHQIDFNIGLFPRNGITRPAGIPRWIVEGTTMMFEVPPSTAGASLGVMNHGRLHELRTSFGQHPLNLGDWKRFLFDDISWFQNNWGGEGASYPLGWAVAYYLWKEHRDGYSRYCQVVTNREDDVATTVADHEKEFEDIFGRVDEKWLKSFYDFLDTLHVKRSLLPAVDDDRSQQHGGERNRGGRGR